MTSQQHFCGACGTQLQSGSRFCRVCGEAISQARADPLPRATAALRPASGSRSLIVLIAALVAVAAIGLIAVTQLGDTQQQSASTPDSATTAEQTSGQPQLANPAAGAQSAEQERLRQVYVDLLTLIPDTPDTRQWVVISNIDYLRQKYDSASTPTSEIVSDWLVVSDWMTNIPSDLSGSGGFFDILGYPGTFAARTHSNLVIFAGFGYHQIDQAITAGQAPNIYNVVRGDFDPRLAARLFRSCGECPFVAEVEDYRGVTFFSWAEDRRQHLNLRLAPPAFDSLGRGGRILVQEEYVFRTLWTQGLRDMIDASLGHQSLVDDEDFQLAAIAMADLGAYHVFISDQTQSKGISKGMWDEIADSSWDDQESARKAWDPPSGVPVLRPYSVLGLGHGLDESGEQWLGIVLVHDSPQAARANVDLLTRRIAETSSLITSRPWASQIRVINIEIDGRVLLATVKGLRNILFWLQGDPLLLHE